MFTKYIIVVSGEVDIRNYPGLLRHILGNTDPAKDLLFASGPLDVLDHASDICALGGKLGLDATVKLQEEISVNLPHEQFDESTVLKNLNNSKETIISANLLSGFPVAVIGINPSDDSRAFEKTNEILSSPSLRNTLRLVLAVDSNVDVYDWYTVAWQVLGNTDPVRDIAILSDTTIFIDATIKAFSRRGFPRRWPNVVCSGEETIKIIDQKWESLGIGPFIPSPSLKTTNLIHGGGAEVSLQNGGLNIFSDLLYEH